MMLAYLIWGFSALMIGAAIGPLQALNYGGINAYPDLQPVLQSYYQGLTIHGVLNGYVFTFFITSGLLVYLSGARTGSVAEHGPVAAVFRDDGCRHADASVCDVR